KSCPDSELGVLRTQPRSVSRRAQLRSRRTTGENPIRLAAASRRRLDKILQQLQTDRLALLRMELGGKHVLLPNRRGEALAVGRARRHDRWVNRFGKKTVHEINVAAAWYAAQNRTIRSNPLDLVPADLGDFQPRFLA